MKARKVRRRLDRALESKRAVRVWRDAYDTAYNDGFVIALPGDWVVMHMLDDGVYLDGVVMMRVRDVTTARDGHSEYPNAPCVPSINRSQFSTVPLTRRRAT